MLGWNSGSIVPMTLADVGLFKIRRPKNLFISLNIISKQRPKLYLDLKPNEKLYFVLLDKARKMLIIDSQ